MRTIGRRYPRTNPHGDYARLCDVCKVRWYRLDMHMTADGQIRCPDCTTEGDAVTLARRQAERMESYRDLEPVIEDWE